MQGFCWNIFALFARHDAFVRQYKVSYRLFFTSPRQCKASLQKLALKICDHIDACGKMSALVLTHVTFVLFEKI